MKKDRTMEKIKKKSQAPVREEKKCGPINLPHPLKSNGRSLMGDNLHR